MVALCHWGGFRGEGKCPGETCTWSWQSQGHEINVSPPLAQTRWLQPVQALSLTSCARESCPSLNFGETGRPKPKSCPLLFGKVKPDFHPAWLCPTVLNFTGYANTLCCQGQGSISCPVLWPLCPVIPLSCPHSTSAHCWSWGLGSGYRGASMRAEILATALAKPLLWYRVRSCHSAKPHPVSQKKVQGQWTYTKQWI